MEKLIAATVELLGAITSLVQVKGRVTAALLETAVKGAYPLTPAPSKVEVKEEEEVAAATGRTPLTAGEPAKPAKKSHKKKDASPEAAEKQEAEAAAVVGSRIAPLSKKPLSELTEEESAKEVYEYGKLLCRTYNKLCENGPDGQPAAEGYHMARKLLAEKFRVARVADLVHAKRLEYMADVSDLIAQAQRAPAARPQPAAAVPADPAGIGV